MPIKERINLNFPGLNLKQNIFLRKVARPRCGSVGAVTPNSSYGGTLVWCMVSLNIIESVPGLLSTFPLHSCMQYRDCRQCRQGRFSLTAESAMCYRILFFLCSLIFCRDFGGPPLRVLLGGTGHMFRCEGCSATAPLHSNLQPVNFSTWTHNLT